MRQSVPTRYQRSHRQRIPLRPLLERLEDRTVPSSGLSGPPVIDDVPAHSFATIALNGAGAGVRSGTIDYAGDSDLYAFVSSVTGQTTIKVDGGVIPEQIVSVLVTAGKTYAFSVFANGTATGSYRITITSIADDFPDTTTFPIVLNADGSGVQNGVINYANDVDFFKFVAPVSGIMTLTMSTPTLKSSLTVTGATILHDFTPSVSRDIRTGIDIAHEIIQFQAVAGRTYKLRAAGDLGTTGNYTLSFLMVKDDFSATAPTSIDLDAPGFASFSTEAQPGFSASTLEHGTLMGSIEVPGDVDRFQFTAGTTGYAIIQLDGAPNTDFHGMLTTSVPFLAVDPDRGFVVPSPFGGFFNFINAAGEATLTTEYGGNTLDPIVIIPVVAGESYQIGVSGDGILAGKSTDPTIGKYTLIVDTFSSDAVGAVTVRRGAFDGEFTTQYSLIFAFLGPSEEPIFNLVSMSVSPEFGSDPPPPPTDARLAIATLPSSAPLPPITTPTAPTLDVPVVGTGGTIFISSSISGTSLPASSTGSTSLPASSTGSTSLPASSLVAALLTVATRDNSLAGLPVTANASSTLATVAVAATAPAIQRDAAAPGGWEGGMTITGTVFDDVNGDGIRQPDEPGLPRETVVLEHVQDGRTVAVSTITDANGKYRFADLKPGEYQLSLRRDAGLPGALSRLTRVHVRIIVPSISPVVNLGRQGSRGVQLNLEPPDLTAVAIPSVAAFGEDFWLLSELNADPLEARSPEAIDAVCTGCLLFISGAHLRQYDGDRRSAGRSGRWPADAG